MNKFEIKLSPNFDEDEIITKFRKAVAQQALTIKNETALKSIPSSIHWHIIRPNETGTLEATFDKIGPRMWLSYHDNRYADWIDDAIVKIKQALESK